MFDAYIKRIAQYVDEIKAKGREIKVFDPPVLPFPSGMTLPIRIGPQANSGLILREDTFVELGNPEAGSCSILLWTTTPFRIHDNRITVIGPDIQESGGKSLPFGQVVIVGGKTLDEKGHESLQRLSFVDNFIEGYMVRSMSQNVWSRVSKKVAQRGFSLQFLGLAMMAIFRSANPQIEASETVFITSSKEDVQQLEGIAAQVQKLNRDIAREKWRIRGYDIDCALDCSTCPEKKVCDDIREVLRAKKIPEGI